MFTLVVISIQLAPGSYFLYEIYELRSFSSMIYRTVNGDLVDYTLSSNSCDIVTATNDTHIQYLGKLKSSITKVSSRLWKSTVKGPWFSGLKLDNLPSGNSSRTWYYVRYEQICWYHDAWLFCASIFNRSSDCRCCINFIPSWHEPFLGWTNGPTNWSKSPK